MIQQPENTQPSKEENDEADKMFLNDESTSQSPKEPENKKDEYYEVDEKKLVITNIGDGTPHDEGLAGLDEADIDQDQDQ
jgi:hypothetical protein